MLLLADVLTVDIEVLDADNRTLARMPAKLKNLDGESAIICLPLQDSFRRLRWGTRVRFQMGEGPSCYLVTGMVVAEELEGLLDDEENEPNVQEQELLIRLWECRSIEQRRRLPRRSSRFSVHFAPIPTPKPGGSGPEKRSLERTAVVEEENWREGWCVDIGGGGMRLRTPDTGNIGKRLRVHFNLVIPQADFNKEVCFDLQATVLRVAPCGRNASQLEIAVRFEHLTVEEGIALAQFLGEHG